MHYYKHHLGDYETRTRHLSLAEHGAYRLLIDAYYATEEPLSLDIKRVCKMIRVSNRAESRHVLSILLTFFEQNPDGYRHKRIDREIALYREKALINKCNAKRLAQRNVSQSHSETDTKPLTSNHKPVTNIHIPPISPRGELPENGFKQFWDEYGLKVARPLAVKAFAAAIKKTDMQTILAGVKQYKTSIAASGLSQAHPSSWLNAERWLDEPQRIENGKQHAPDRADIKPGNKTDRLNAAIQRAVANSAHITGFGGPGEPGADTRPMLPGPESVRKGAGTDRSDDRPASNGVSELFD